MALYCVKNHRNDISIILSSSCDWVFSILNTEIWNELNLKFYDFGGQLAESANHLETTRHRATQRRAAWLSPVLWKDSERGRTRRTNWAWSFDQQHVISWRKLRTFVKIITQENRKTAELFFVLIWFYNPRKGRLLNLVLIEFWNFSLVIRMVVY